MMEHDTMVVCITASLFLSATAFFMSFINSIVIAMRHPNWGKGG